MTVFAGQPINASDINDWLPITSVKAALTGRNTTVTNTADPDLALNLLAGATYSFRAELFMSSAANAAGDFRGAFTWSGTGTMTYGGLALVTALASGGSGDLIASPTSRLDTSSPSADFLAGCSSSGMHALLSGRFVSTTTNVLTLVWSQRVSNANDTRLLEGSSLTAYRIA